MEGSSAPVKQKEYVGELTQEGQALLADKDCPVKKEYRVENWKVPNKLQPKDDDDDEGEAKEPEQKRKRGKGKNKNNNNNNKKKNPWLGGRPGMVPRLGPQLCQAFAEGHCKFGDACKFNHNIDTFLAAKPANLGDQCHVFNTYGSCPAGIKCRFSACHTTDGGRVNVVDEAKYAPHKEALTAQFPPTGEVLLNQLLKGQYKHTKADAVSAIYDADFVERETTKSQTGAGAATANPAVVAAVAAAAAAGPSHKRPHADGSWAALEPSERKPLDLAGKLYLAPLTTIGNSPFRRVCVDLGCDITCGEMAVSENILKGKRSEWVLMKRHPSEKLFGVQIASNKVWDVCASAKLAEDYTQCDFVDINCGCPIDVITKLGMGSALLDRPTRLRDMCIGLSKTLERVPFTIKVRTGKKTGLPTIQKILPELKSWGCAGITLHGRSWEQRYTKEADWDFIRDFAKNSPIPVIGNGDVWDYNTFKFHMENDAVSSIMFARGAIMKPWVFKEIKERRMWDISSGERFDILKSFCNYGLEHWGSDWEGVEKTRNFLLQTLSFMHRYVPIGLLERYPVEMWHRPVPFVGRDDLETLMGSPYSEHWVELSEMLLGPVPDGFRFEPKHASNSYSKSVLENTPAVEGANDDEW